VEEFETLSEQVTRLTAECERLGEENEWLQRLLSQHPRPETEPQAEPPPQRISDVSASPVVAPQSSDAAGLSVPEKISLFRGREDVYAIRWESADGKSGYSPASIRDWKAVMSAPPAERKKLDQATPRLLPLTDDAIHQHLSGRKYDRPLSSPRGRDLLVTGGRLRSGVVGVRCRFVYGVVSRHGCSGSTRAFPFRSRGSWIFFSAPVPAILARKRRTGLLTRTMQRRHQISLKSYDRLFPNQDTMPTGGFGNLIALPLQKIPRRADNSLFVDDHLVPLPTSGVICLEYPE